MKINANKLTLSSVIVTGFLWVACSFMVAIMPSPMVRISGAMLHTKLNDLNWHVTIEDMLIGGVAWVFMVAIAVWLVATLYNIFVSK